MDIQFGKLKVGDKFLVRNSDSGDAEEAVRTKIKEIKWRKAGKVHKANATFECKGYVFYHYHSESNPVICVQPNETHAGDIVRNATCEECGDVIKIAVVQKSGKTVCNRCLYPRLAECGNIFSSPEQTFGYWDNAVRVCEA
jgi:hypothetical protein